GGHGAPPGEGRKHYSYPLAPEKVKVSLNVPPILKYC
ncbi:hypothetical protein TNCV_2101121, partial [Trichonephila clavipes]